MRITRLHLNDVRRHRDLDLEFAPGVTVVRGPNEAGKTTIQRALELALARKVTSTSADLAIVHRLSAPTLAEARRSVRHAVEFLAGRAAASSVGGRRQTDFASGPSRDPSLSALDLLNRTPDPQRGVVPSFDLGSDRTPTDHLPAPLS